MNVKYRVQLGLGELEVRRKNYYDTAFAVSVRGRPFYWFVQFGNSVIWLWRGRESAQSAYYFLRRVTLCKRGHHCKPGQRIQKFEGGRLPQLCRYCRLIVDWGPVREGK